MGTFTILCLLVLADMVLGRPVGHLVRKLSNVDWSDKFASLVGNGDSNLRDYALRAGRLAVTPVLTFYYVIRYAETSLTEKILIFAAIAYVLSPSLVPKRLFSVLGMLDDGIAIAYVLNKIADKVTPDITARVNATLDAWFSTFTGTTLPSTEPEEVIAEEV